MEHFVESSQGLQDINYGTPFPNQDTVIIFSRHIYSNQGLLQHQQILATCKFNLHKC
jgi:hypothetical protein